jgi:hypothetical protein
MLNVPNDPAYDRVKAKQENSAKAKTVLRGAGYARGGGVGAKKAVHKHEAHLHKGEKKTKLKHGGKVEGKHPKVRADKYARGGAAPKGKHTNIHINVGNPAEKQQALKAGVQLGTAMAAHKMAGGARPGAGAPPMARPMPPAPPMGARPPMPPGGALAGGPPGVPPTMGMAARGGRMYKRGGGVGPKKVAGVTNISTGGGGGAKGRMEKMRKYGTKPKKA